MWAGLPVQLGTRLVGRSDETPGADEAWGLPKSQNVRDTPVPPSPSWWLFYCTNTVLA